MSTVTVTDVVQVIADDLAADLAPLNSIHHDFARYRCEAEFDETGLNIHVYAPSRVRILIPKTYKSFPVIFHEWEQQEEMSIDIDIDTTGFEHNLYG